MGRNLNIIGGHGRPMLCNACGSPKLPRSAGNARERHSEQDDLAIMFTHVDVADEVGDYMWIINDAMMPLFLSP
eukprot:3609986-Pyramimonas_sp.AAC.1